MDEQYLDLAEHFLRIENPKRALEELDKINQFSRTYWYLRAWANYKLKNFQQAKEFLLKALEDNPDDLQILYLLTQSERQLGNLKSAEQHISKLIELYPEHASTRELYAIIMMKLNRHSAMKKAFAEAKRLRGESQNNLLNATTASMRGKLKEAIGSIEQALLDRPEDHLAHNLAAKYYQQNWQYSKALKHAIYALRLEPSEPSYQKHVRRLKVLNNPIHKPFAQIIYLNKSYRYMPVIILASIFTIIFLYGIFTNNSVISVTALSIAINIFISFVAYGFASFIIATIYRIIKKTRL